MCKNEFNMIDNGGIEDYGETFAGKLNVLKL